MSQQNTRPSRADDPSVPTEAFRPISLLIRGFGQAVEQFVSQADPSREASIVEALAILANATHRALGQTDELDHGLACGNINSIGREASYLDEEDYHDWWDAASPLYDRVQRLERLGAEEDLGGYESKSCQEFAMNFDAVREIVADYQRRREAERNAPSADRLMALAARLEAGRSPGIIEERPA